MRIRKNAKLSPLWFSHPSAPEALQTHVCQLNQSPWDAISFAQDSHQFEGEDSFTGNASLGDSVGADESVASMMDAVAAKAEDMAMDDNDMVEKRAKVIEHGEERMRGNEFELQKGERSSCCQKTDGKGWQCRNEAKEGQSLCEHHLNLLRSYNNSNLSFRRSAPAAAAAAAAAGARRARARAAKKAGSSSNPYEFYYYSGFGPLWGRKRGHRGGGGADARIGKHIEPKRVDSNATTTTTITTTTSTASISNTSQSTPSSSQLDNNEDFEYVDDEDYDDDDEDEAANGDSGKKRMRKPVKARSLKSLM